MQTINEIRKENFRVLMNSLGLNASGIARWLGVTPQAVSQVLTGTRNIGDRLARKIEKQFKKAEGWLDREHSLYGDAYDLVNASKPKKQVVATDATETLLDDFVLVPRLMLNPSKDAAAPWTVEEKGQRQALRAAWTDRLGLQAGNLASLTAEGGGMFPRINDGDTLIVDLKDTSISSGKIYTLMVGEELVVRRAFHIPGGGLRIACDNNDKNRFPDWDVPMDQSATIKTVGRVVALIGAL